MEHLLQFVQVHFPILVAHKYLFLFVGAVIEGFNVLIFGGFLVSTKAINLGPAFIIFLIGDTLNGYAWYTVGYFAGSKPIDKWGRRDPKSRRIIDKVQEYFEKYSGRSIIVTKFTFSLTIATLITAGSFKYNIKRFSLYNFIGSLGWVSLTMFTGYFFGQSYKFFFNYLQGLGYFLLFLGLAILLIYILKSIFGTAFVKSLFVTEKLKEIGEKLRGELDKLLTSEEDKK